MTLFRLLPPALVEVAGERNCFKHRIAGMPFDGGRPLPHHARSDAQRGVSLSLFSLSPSPDNRAVGTHFNSGKCRRCIPIFAGLGTRWIIGFVMGANIPLAPERACIM